MERVVVALLCVGAAALGRAATAEGGASQKSVRLTAAAEQLLECEKKIVSGSADALDGVLYNDVVALLDLAVETNPGNLHARALRAELLLHQAYDGRGQYDVCYLLDARDDANFVVSREARAPAADVAMARAVLHGIERIPPDAIPDPPSSCNDEERQPGSKASLKTR